MDSFEYVVNHGIEDFCVVFNDMHNVYEFM